MDGKRIIIAGSAGSGKSWLAKRLAQATGYPLVHLDREFWQPGWIHPPREAWIARQRELMAGDRWIIDGDYRSTLELRFEAADTVVFLDIPRVVCLIGAIRRHGKKRSDLPEYLEEKFDKEFLDFLKLIWIYPRNDRPRILALHDKYPDKPFVVLKSRGEVARWVESLAEPIDAAVGEQEAGI